MGVTPSGTGARVYLTPAAVRLPAGRIAGLTGPGAPGLSGAFSGTAAPPSRPLYVFFTFLILSISYSFFSIRSYVAV